VEEEDMAAAVVEVDTVVVVLVSMNVGSMET
jgi:hypothetical protein